MMSLRVATPTTERNTEALVLLGNLRVITKSNSLKQPNHKGEVTDNGGVYLRSAIEICLMKLLDKPQADIEKLTKKARTPKIY